MKCSCGQEIEENKIFNLLINNEIVNVCENCWWKSLKPQSTGEENVFPTN